MPVKHIPKVCAHHDDGDGDGGGDDGGGVSGGRIRKGGLEVDPRLSRVTLSASQCFCWHRQSSKWDNIDNYN